MDINGAVRHEYIRPHRLVHQLIAGQDSAAAVTTPSAGGTPSALA